MLFLDEIGELEASLQAKLLRVLQENRVLGVGEDREIQVNVRVVAATNRDLDQLGQQSRFRVDLFHRLNVLSIRVPPLSERADDLAPLTQHFLEKYRSLCCGGLPEVGADFLDALQQIALPGNVRQLENLIRQALVRRRTDRHEFDFPQIRGGSVKELSGKDGTRVGTIFPAMSPAKAKMWIA